MKVLILAAISLIGVVSHAQQVSPVYAEGKAGKKSMKGQFTVQNLGVAPMPVTIEPRQLVIVDGKGTFGALQDATVVLKDTSAVVAPRSARTFDYEVNCPKECMVMMLSGMTTGRTREGVTVKLWIPSSVYACVDTAKNCRARIKKEAGLE
jgi:hypothetical protein